MSTFAEVAPYLDIKDMLYFRHQDSAMYLYDAKNKKMQKSIPSQYLVPYVTFNIENGVMKLVLDQLPPQSIVEEHGTSHIPTYDKYDKKAAELLNFERALNPSILAGIYSFYANSPELLPGIWEQKRIKGQNITQAQLPFLLMMMNQGTTSRTNKRPDHLSSGAASQYLIDALRS
jgi:hypothetical protein